MADEPSRDHPPEAPQPGATSEQQEYTKAQSLGCLITFAIAVLLLVVPKAYAMWDGLHSDGTWIYPLIGILIFIVLTFTTYTTGKIPYRSEDMDLRKWPVAHYGATAIFALCAVGLYVLYLALVFGW